MSGTIITFEDDDNWMTGGVTLLGTSPSYIGVIPLQLIEYYTFNGHTVGIGGITSYDCDDPEILHSLRELFAKCRTGTTLHEVPGWRPYGEDLDEEQRNTQYIIFNQGDKSITGWYLLRNFTMMQTETPRGFAYNFDVVLFFLGTKSYYQPGFKVYGMDDVEDEVADNDWGI